MEKKGTLTNQQTMIFSLGRRLDLGWIWLIWQICSSQASKADSSHLKIGHPKRKYIFQRFQPSIFGGYVSFREGIFTYFSVKPVQQFWHWHLIQMAGFSTGSTEKSPGDFLKLNFPNMNHPTMWSSPPKSGWIIEQLGNEYSVFEWWSSKIYRNSSLNGIN